MKKKKILFLVLLLLFLILLVGYSYLQEKEEEEGVAAFITGNKYLEMSDSSVRAFYIYGLIDMYSYLIFRYSPEIYSDFLEKIEGMTVQQITAIFDKYLKEHPETWHYNAASNFIVAIMELKLNEK